MGNYMRKLKCCCIGTRSGPQSRTVVPNIHVDDNIPSGHKSHPNGQYKKNLIRTTKYSIITFLPINLFEQFHRFANLFFIFVVVLNWIPEVSAFAKEASMIPVAFVLGVPALKDAYEDFRRYKNDKRVNRLTCRVYSDKHTRYLKKTWEQMKVGDFVHLGIDEVIPADILLLSTSDPQGICHVETSTIDGETNLKQRYVVKGPSYQHNEFHPSEFRYNIECDLPNPDIYKFHGELDLGNGEKCLLSQNNLILRGCIIRNTDYVEGIIIYGGHETKTMLNNGGPRYKRSKLEKRLNRDVVWCVIMLLFMCFFCSIGGGLWVGSFEDLAVVPFLPIQDIDTYGPLFQGFIVFWTYIVVFQAIIPLPLYVSIELIKLGQVYFIQSDIDMYYEPTDKPTICRALNITEDLGQVEYLFSDKTGTLTENKMDFKCCSIGGIDFPHGVDNDDSNSDIESRYSMANMSRCSSIIFDLKLEQSLHRDVSIMSLRSLNSIDLCIPDQSRRVQEFFLLMAICNTVVVSSHPHEDVMDASGFVPESEFAQAKTNQKTEQPLDRYNRLEDSLSTSTPQKNGLFRYPSDLNLSSSSGDLDLSYPQTPEGSITGTEASFISEATLKTRYEAESPDEHALVKAACTYGCRLVKRTANSVTVFLPQEGDVQLKILHMLPFDSIRKRMSVIIRHPISKQFVLYTKGADSAILSVLAKSFKEDIEGQRIISLTTEHLDNYAKKGLRTLCMAKREIPAKEYKSWKRSHMEAEHAFDNREQRVFESICSIETNLELLGATGIEDQLQEGVPETIDKLRRANIKVWVLTGDKQETAIQIAYACKLISADQQLITINAKDRETTADLLEHHLSEIEQSRSNSQASVFTSDSSSICDSSYPSTDLALVIDGQTMSFALEEDLQMSFVNLAKKCTSVVCCRSTPVQKAAIVKLIQDKLKKLSLAIGDGANDVGMIQVADVGVGISGQEGMQAVMAADFSLARFRYLERLVLVHGHWCYDRLAQFTLFMFYKNPFPTFILFWYQIFSAFSGSLQVDPFLLMLLHVTFTSVPPLINGIFDKDLSAEILLANPHLYRTGQKGKSYTSTLFGLTLLDALVQSLVVYFIPHFFYDDTTVGIWEMGTTIMVAIILTMLLHLAIETHCWSWMNWVGIIMSFFVFYAFGIIFSGTCVSCPKPSNPYWVMENTIVQPAHWLLVILIIVMALLPRFTFRSLQTSLFPDDIRLMKIREKATERHRNIERVQSQEAGAIQTVTMQPIENKLLNGVRRQDPDRRIRSRTATPSSILTEVTVA